MSTPAGVETRGPAILGVAVAFPILASIFVVLRVYSRTRVIKFFGADDWCSIATLIASIAYSVCIGIWSTHGGGMHQYDITDDIKKEYYKWLMIASEFYLLGILGYKTAILLLYIRLFSIHKTFKWICYGVMAFNASYLIANMILQIFSCTPVQKFYDSDLPGHCTSLVPPDIAFGAMFIVSDFAIALLPIPVVWKLKMSKRDKILISLVFLSGLIAFVTSTVRWILATVDLTAVDRTWIAGVTFLFSIIEVNTGIICGCTPALKPLFSSIRHRKTSYLDGHEKTAMHHPSSSTDEEAAGNPHFRAPPGTMNLSNMKSIGGEESSTSDENSDVQLSESSADRPSIIKTQHGGSTFSEDLLNLPLEGTKQRS